MSATPTPRTDEAWHESRHGEDRDALVTEARKLEVELAEAKAKLDRMGIFLRAFERYASRRQDWKRGGWEYDEEGADLIDLAKLVEGRL